MISEARQVLTISLNIHGRMEKLIECPVCWAFTRVEHAAEHMRVAHNSTAATL